MTRRRWPARGAITPSAHAPPPKASARAICVVVALTSCADLTEADRFQPDLGPLEIVSTVPEHGALDVDPASNIDICFSDPLDPRSVREFDAVLSSGVVTFDTQTSVQLFAWRPPGARSGLADTAWCPGSVLTVAPRGDLRRGSTYRVRLRPAPRGWAGETLDLDAPGWAEDPDGELFYTVEFSVPASEGDGDGDGDGDGADDDDDGPTLTDLFAPGEVFDPERGACGCHQDGPREDPLARARLDLGSVDEAFQQLVEDRRVGATGFLLVTERRPSSSYLVHKLMRDEEGQALHSVLGDPMPQGAQLPHRDLAMIAAWIAAGARE